MTTTTACSRLINTVELLESVLEYVPERKLVTLARVNRYFKETIKSSPKLQTKLYLLAPADASSKPEYNATVFTESSYSQRMISDYEPSKRHLYILYRLELPEHIFTLADRTPSDSLSCQDMFITSPPVKQVWLAFVRPLGPYRLYKHIWRYLKIYRDEGVKVGDVMQSWYRLLEIKKASGQGRELDRDWCFIDIKGGLLDEPPKRYFMMSEEDLW